MRPADMPATTSTEAQPAGAGSSPRRHASGEPSPRLAAVSTGGGSDSGARVLMLAAEHGGLPGGKVGGIGDVIEQLPQALVAAGVPVDVLLPSYGVYQEMPGAMLRSRQSVEFAGSEQQVELYELPLLNGAGCWVIHHPIFGAPPGQIYHHDADDQPFATDANIYALFCAAAAELLVARALPVPEVVHLHDWHTGTFAVLARNHPQLAHLGLVYTVHNLAMQGTRPLSSHASSLGGWFPHLELSIKDLCDPRYPDCYNPMRAGITLADKVHVVSPSYAQEVLESNDPAVGLHGGEGLEFDLVARAEEGNLHGILNGCDYDAQWINATADVADAEGFAQQRQNLLRTLESTLARWFADNDALRSCDYLARETLAELRSTLAGRFLVTSVGRITEQKLGLLLHCGHTGRTTLLDRLLGILGDRGALVLLGTGDAALERILVEHAARHKNLVFLRGYSDQVAQALYAAGDLFLMPSLFEPCGISQLLAMSAGQPPLVHAVGGLQDTVTDGLDGFQFAGEDLDEKATNCAEALQRALRLYGTARDWRELRKQASAKRVTWSSAARAYIEQLYTPVRARRRTARQRVTSQPVTRAGK